MYAEAPDQIAMNNTVVFIRSMHFFGDQLVTYPLLYQLRKSRPDDHVCVVAHDPVQSYYSGLPWVDSFVLASGFTAKYRSMPAHTNLVVALHHSSEQYSLLSAVRGARIRLGFDNRRAFDFLWTHSCKKDSGEYIGLANLHLLRTLYDFSPIEAAQGCMAWIASNKTEPVQTSDVVFMVGGGAGAFKRWGLDNYMALADRLKLLLGSDTTFTFILGPAEAEETALLKQCARPDFRLLVSRPQAEIAHVSLNARLIVANDCGPSHIAQNAGGPYVGIFNEANPEWFWQRGNSRAVVPADGSSDIQAITVDQVYAACGEALSGSSPA